VWISAVRSEIYFAGFLHHFIERDLDPRVAFPVHLGITVAEDADKPNPSPPRSLGDWNVIDKSGRKLPA
jgi:hypothetical protein